MSKHLEVHKKALDDVRAFEDKHLTRWQRFKARYMRKEHVLIWNLSSWITIAQLLAGKKIWLWLCTKFTWVAPLCSKIWSYVLAAFAAAMTIVSP